MQLTLGMEVCGEPRESQDKELQLWVNGFETLDLGD